MKTGKPLDTEDIHLFMDKMGGEARKITFRLNSAYHTPEETRDILSELFGKTVPATLRVFPPFYTDFGKNIDRAQCGVCHAQPFFGPRKTQDDLFRAYRPREECLGRIQRLNPARRNHRRQCRDWRRGGRYRRHTYRYGCGRSAGKGGQTYMINAVFGNIPTEGNPPVS